LRNLGEIGFGVLLAIGAVFNTTYTLRNGAEFYRSFADGAWLPPARAVLDKVVIPNATTVTVTVILFEATAALLILTRGGLVQPALIAGAGFALLAAVASSPGGTIANLILAALMLILAMTR
jgi:hypothetical protein